MVHVIGDLRSKLRAKFPRRNSGIPSVASSKNSNALSNESDTQSRPLSKCISNGQHPSSLSEPGNYVPVSPAAEGAEGSEEHGGDDGPLGGSKSSHSGRQATTLTTAGEARDRLRQETKQEIGSAANHSADVRAGLDTDDGDNSFPQSQQSRAAVATATAAAASSACNNGSAENATSAKMRSAETLSAHPAAPGSNGPDMTGNDQRALMLKLSHVNEPNSSDIATSIDWNTTAAHLSDRASIADAVLNERSVASTAAPTEQLRRIKLSDPPVPVSPAVSNTNLGYSNSFNLRHSSSNSRPAGPIRRQSLLPSRQTTLIRTLLSAAHADDIDPASADLLLPISGNMVTRKIWVKRPGASATLITINEDDLVDDVRDMILRKYANSLGRHFDAPDLTLRIAPREQQRQERLLGPEEPMARTLDAYYPGGQTVDEALIIDVPPRRTPRASPRTGPPHAQHLTSAYLEDSRPPEAGTDYFGPEAVANPPSAVSATAPNGTAHQHAMSIINTGQVPQIPSPGGTRSRPYRERPDRPRLNRQHTSSPTILNVVGANGHPATIAIATNHDQSTTGLPPPAPPLPTPPVQETTPIQTQRTATPPPRTASPRPPISRVKKKKPATELPAPSAGLLGGVPPINVLIVEDNIINLRLLEAFIKRLKVRWETAMNGQEAVTKWRAGGFHLVLMDIQLPVMSGLEATREIRRLERMNSIGAFSSSPTPTPGEASKSKKTKGDERDTNPEDGTTTSDETTAEKDKLENRELFKSPVIIVALTASSLQSDRHQALAAGCNDFLTKPVTYVWLERKVMEWGCMQALIDFDGWRKWKSYSQNGDAGSDTVAATAVAASKKTKKNRQPQNTSSLEAH